MPDAKEELVSLIASLMDVYHAARLKRNAVLYDDDKFEGRWIAIPEEDFMALRNAEKKVRDIFDNHFLYQQESVTPD